MNYSVFYSWQSDLPNKTNRSLIQTCIKKSLQNLSSSDNTGMKFSYDESTAGEVGTPDIGETILQKIQRADIFICDISIINKNSKFRKTPNPNVLFELGYAASTLGWDKIICLFNTLTGRLSQLPFDINHKRVMSYSSDDPKCKIALSSSIEKAISAMIQQRLLYNPLKDRLKGKIDHCFLVALEQLCCLIYGTLTMGDALLKVQELLKLSEEDIASHLADGHQILGFFTQNTLQDIRDMLDDIFIEITASSLYPTNWAVTILNFVDWLRSYQWHISDRSNMALTTKAHQSIGTFLIVSGRQQNDNNRPDSYILLKRTNGNKGKVLYNATMPSISQHVLLTFQNILSENIPEYSTCFSRLISLANEWLLSTGDEFILDPDYYEIT